jgi:methionyl-tRNA formyltransferase
MKIVLFSATEFGYKYLRKLLQMEEKIVGIFTIPKML